MISRSVYSAAIAVIVALSFSCARPQIDRPSAAHHVILDGEFRDWMGVPIAARANPSATAVAELRDVSTQSDAQYVYLNLELAKPVNVVGFAGTVTINVDADGNSSTGTFVDGLSGTDFQVILSPRDSTGRLIQGILVRVFGGAGHPIVTNSYALDFVSQPTYEASRFEMRIARGRVLDSMSTMRTFAGATFHANITSRDSTGAIVSEIPTFTGALPALSTAPRAVATTDPLSRAPGTQFRALQWNVANEGILERPDHFRRIFNAVQPDLLILDEVAGKAGRERVGDFLRTVGDGKWNYTYGGGGGYQRTVIASHDPVSEFQELHFVPFPDSLINEWLPLVAPAGREKERGSINDALSAGGALVTIRGKRVAIFGVDLQSAGNRPDSWQEVRRRAETRLIREKAIAAIRARGSVDAIIAAGDHNLVSTREPLTTITTIGTPFFGKPLETAYLLQLDSATAATWEGGNSTDRRFPPGRLDWITYSAPSLQLLGGFAFDVGDLDERWRRAHGLEADDSKFSSDHRPLIADFKFR